MQLTTPYHEAYEKLEDLGWKLKSIKLTNGLYVAKAEGPSGKKSERIGQSPELALAALVLSAQRHNSIRKKAAIQAVAAWQHDFSKHREGIARAYSEAPAFDAKAVPAWRALADESKKQADAIRKQIKVEVTDKPEPYVSHHEMRHDVHHKKRYQVSRAGADHPVWTPEEVQDFRIVNDVIGHAQSGADYSFDGVTKAFNHHAPHLTPAAREALFVETIGRAAYKHTYPAHGPNKVVLMSDFLNDAHQTEGEHVSIPHGATPDADEGMAEVIKQIPQHTMANTRDLFLESLTKGRTVSAARDAAAAYLGMLKLGAAAQEAADGLMFDHLKAKVKPKRNCGHSACWCTHLAKLVVGADINDLFKRAVQSFVGRADVQQWSQKLLDAGWNEAQLNDNPEEFRTPQDLTYSSPLDWLIQYFEGFRPESYKLLDWVYNKVKKGEIQLPHWFLASLGQRAYQQLFPAYGSDTANMNHARDIANQAGALMLELKAKNKLPKGFDVNRLSFQELDDWVAEEHAKKVGEGWMERPVVYTDPESGYTVEEVNTREDLAREGKLMQHCVGGYYGSGTQIYSLRDSNGKPHVTVEISKRDNGDWDILQTQAPSDSVPKPEYKAMLDRWYESLRDNGIDVENREEREPEMEYVPTDDVPIHNLDDLESYYQMLQRDPWEFKDDEEGEFNENDNTYYYNMARQLDTSGDELREIALEFLFSLIRNPEDHDLEEAETIAQALYSVAHHFDQVGENRGGRDLNGNELRYAERDDRVTATEWLKELVTDMQAELSDAPTQVQQLQVPGESDGQEELFSPQDYDDPTYLARTFVQYLGSLANLSESYSLPQPDSPGYGQGGQTFYRNRSRDIDPDNPTEVFDEALEKAEMKYPAPDALKQLNLPAGDSYRETEFPQYFEERGMHDITNFPQEPQTVVPLYQRSRGDRAQQLQQQWQQHLYDERRRQQFEREQADRTMQNYVQQRQNQAKTAADNPAYRFVYFNTGLNIQPWHHNLRYRDLRHQLLKDFGIDQIHAFDDVHNEWAGGDVFRDGYGEYRIDLQGLAERDVQLEATTAVMGWLADNDVPDWEEE